MGQNFSAAEIAGWRTRLALVCQSCPVHSHHPDFCPLKDLAGLKPGRQIDFINTLPVEALRYVLARHEICLEVEVEKLLRFGELLGSADPKTLDVPV
jgi:hypothetical protein